MYDYGLKFTLYDLNSKSGVARILLDDTFFLQNAWIHTYVQYNHGKKILSVTASNFRGVDCAA